MNVSYITWTFQLKEFVISSHQGKTNVYISIHVQLYMCFSLNVALHIVQGQEIAWMVEEAGWILLSTNNPSSTNNIQHRRTGRSWWWNVIHCSSNAQIWSDTHYQEKLHRRPDLCGHKRGESEYSYVCMSEAILQKLLRLILFLKLLVRYLWENTLFTPI